MMTASDTADHGRRFQPLRTAAFARFAAGDYGGVLPFALRAEQQFPEKGEVPFWLACVHCRLGRPEAALAALRAGLERGLYWPQDWLLEDDDLEPLHGRADFAEVVRAAAQAEAAAVPPETLTPVVLEPPTASAPVDVPAARVVALHGWGQDADEFALHWRAAAAAGCRVLVARSSQEPCPGFFVWDDRERAVADIAAQVAVAGGPAGGRPATLLLAGFSQGGGIAIDLAVDGLPAPAAGFAPAHPAGVLAVAAGLEDLAEPPSARRLAPAAARGLRAQLLVGDGDDAADDVRGLADALARGGLAERLTVLPGLLHEMPEPPGELLAAELLALLR
jgi:hypothetical protein